MTAVSERPPRQVINRGAPARRVTPRTANKYRNVIAAVYDYGCKPTTLALSVNPAKSADKRREQVPGVLVFYTPNQIEAIARALAEGRHREPDPASADEQLARQAENGQDAEIVRVACGTRRLAAGDARRGRGNDPEGDGAQRARHDQPLLARPASVRAGAGVHRGVAVEATQTAAV